MTPAIGFHDLPAEVMLNIMDNVADFETLATLVTASSHAWRCFGLYGFDIAERILDRDPMHDHVCQAIRTIAYIREGRLPVHGFQEFQDRIAFPVVKHRRTGTEWAGEQLQGGTTDNDIQPLLGPHGLPRYCSPEVLRGILSTARSIAFRTSSCLDYYMERFRSLMPVVPVDLNLGVDLQSPPPLRSAGFDTQIMKAPKDEPPLLWSEEQLVTRALWRCQLIYDLRRAIRKGIIRNWSEADVRKLTRSTIPDIYNTAELERLEVPGMTMRDIYLGVFRKPQMCEHQLLLTVLEYLEQQKPSTHPPAGWARPTRTLEYRTWESDVLLSSDCRSSSIFETVFSNFATDQIDFGIFRGYGFAIWSIKRLIMHGFFTSIPPRSTSNYRLAWTSVLTESHLADLEAWDRECPSAPAYDWLFGRHDLMDPEDDLPTRRRMVLVTSRSRSILPT